VDSTKCYQVKPSLFSQYNSEYQNSETIEEVYGFMTFRVVGVECHMFTMFVSKEYRGAKYSAEMAAKVEEVAKERGCKVLVSYVNLPAPYPEVSLACQFKFGFKIAVVNVNQIVLRKDL